MAATAPRPEAGPSVIEQWTGSNLGATRRLVPGARSVPGPHGPVLLVPHGRGEHGTGTGPELRLAVGGWIDAEGCEVRVVPWHELDKGWRLCSKGLPGRPSGSSPDRWCGRCRFEAARGGGIQG